MADNTNTQTGGNLDTEKTFTQEDVNRIVQERLAKEKSKGATGNSEEDYNKRMKELDLRERKLTAREKLRENGLPDYLVDALNMTTEEDFNKSLEAIKKLKGESLSGAEIKRGNLIGRVQKGDTGDPLKTAFGLK